MSCSRCGRPRRWVCTPSHSSCSTWTGSTRGSWRGWSPSPPRASYDPRASPWSGSSERWTRHSTQWVGSDSLPAVAEVHLRGLLEHHVELFNEAVRTGDYGPFLETFADDA